ncbi:MAG: translation initiation factor [Bradymonadaceae bacterium]
MSKKDRKKKKVSLEDEGHGFGHNPFAELFKNKEERSPSVPSPPQEEKAAGKDDEERPVGQLKKIVLRRERKGRGGKTVTLVEGLEGLDERGRDELAKRLRKALGCGTSVEGTKIVVQGDQSERLEGLLRDEGVKKIVVSG